MGPYGCQRQYYWVLCGRKKAEGKPRCLPKKKAQGMSKEARAKIVQRKEEKTQTLTEKVNRLMFLQS